MDWFIERLNQTNPTLDYKDLIHYGDDFRMLEALKIIKHTQTLESLPCDWCETDHSLVPFLNLKKEVVILCSGNRRVIDPDELKIWSINKSALLQNIKSKNPIIDKASFERTVFALQLGYAINKYSTATEPILIKSLGIEISGNYIWKDSKRARFNETDKCLIYFLYFKFKGNKDECFSSARLVSEIEPDVGRKSERYIKNRVTEINQKIRRLVTTGKTSIGPFIKNESRRGYHLNPKFKI